MYVPETASQKQVKNLSFTVGLLCINAVYTTLVEKAKLVGCSSAAVQFVLLYYVLGITLQ